VSWDSISFACSGVISLDAPLYNAVGGGGAREGAGEKIGVIYKKIRINKRELGKYFTGLSLKGGQDQRLYTGVGSL
jgi:hypothetical protein